MKKYRFLNGKYYDLGIILSSIALLLYILFVYKINVNASEKVVVIDPGHGGENMGAQYHGVDEKDLTLIVAQAMASELSKFDGVIVLMTRNDDEGITIKDRCAYAYKNQADLFVSLHFNASLEHTLYGMETWVSAYGKHYAEGAALGKIWLEEMKDTGIYSRGVKTRLNDEGTDYYGVIRHCKELGITGTIFEHCYLDRLENQDYFMNEDKLWELGKKDAIAVAKFLRLNSEQLALYYQDYPVEMLPTPTEIVRPDTTVPEYIGLKILEVDKENHSVSIQIESEDQESGLLYYDYSLDGGNSFSQLQKWDTDCNKITVKLNYGNMDSAEIIVRAYNGYDLFQPSSAIKLNHLQEVADTSDIENEKNVSYVQQDVNLIMEPQMDFFLVIVFASLIISAVLVLIFVRLYINLRKN